MKKKNKQFRKVGRSKLAVLFFYVQFVIVAPFLFVAVAMYEFTNFILKGWCRYKDWYLSKTLHR